MISIFILKKIVYSWNMFSLSNVNFRYTFYEEGELQYYNGPIDIRQDLKRFEDNLKRPKK